MVAGLGARSKCVGALTPDHDQHPISEPEKELRNAFFIEVRGADGIKLSIGNSNWVGFANQLNFITEDAVNRDRRAGTQIGPNGKNRFVAAQVHDERL